MACSTIALTAMNRMDAAGVRRHARYRAALGTFGASLFVSSVPAVLMLATAPDLLTRWNVFSLR